MFNKNKSTALMVFLFFSFSTITITGNYLPVYFRDIGLPTSQIGLLLAVGPLAAILTQPLWGFMSDRLRSTKKTLIVCIAGAITVSIVLFQVQSFLAFVVVMFLFFCFLSPINPLAESLALKTATEEGRTFGSIRMWGAFGFGVTALISGYIFAVIGIQNILYPFLFFCFFTFLLSLKISDIKTTSKKQVTLMDAVKLGADPKLFGFLLLAMFISITHRTNDNYLGIHIVQLGGKESLIGLATFIGIMVEVIILATSWLWFRKFHEFFFIGLSGLIYAFRWFLMSVITTPEMILFLQLFHGIAFGLFYLAAFQYVTKILPKELQATGHVFFITIVFGLSGMIGSLAGGSIIEYFNSFVLYRVLGYSALVGTISIYLYYIFLDNQENKLVSKPSNIGS